MNLKDHLIELINEVTQGEMEFAELEAARQNYKENFRDDEARHQFGMMVEKLVEPIMSEMGLFLEAEAFYNRGEIVFTNYKNIDVTIDPLGMMGRYDVQVTPLAGSEGEINPMEISLDSMKGVAQFIKDEYRDQLSRGGTYEQPPRGMVGEPEGQMELPLPRESKMRITKSQLQQIIREETKNLKEAASREQIENYLRDIADGMAADGLNPMAIKMGLNDEFMDNFAGMGVPYGAFEEFIEELAMDAGGGIRVENKTKITKTQLQQIIKEEMEAELSEDKYATEDDRPLGTGRSLMSAEDAKKASRMADRLYSILGPDSSVDSAARILVRRLSYLLKRGIAGGRPEPEGLGGPSSAAEMEDYESDYRDPPSKPLKTGKGRRGPSKAQLDMMKDYDI